MQVSNKLIGELGFFAPKLRFNCFNENWTMSKIEDLFDFKNGLNKEKEYFGKGTPIINFKDVYNLTSIKSSDIKGLVELNDSELNRFSANDGDVFFTRTSETIHDIGMSATLIEPIQNCVFSGFVLRARPTTKLLSKFFTSYLFSIESVRKEITTKSSMTTRALTSGSLLNKVCFYYPELTEQNKIAEFISSIDKKIQLLEKKKEQLELYKKGLMQKIFSREIRFKDDNGNDFPDWVEKRLGEVSKLQGGYAFKSNSFKDTGIPIIRISNISNNNNYLNLENLVHYDEISNEENFTVMKGDLIIAMSGATTGKTSISNYDGKCYLNQRVGLFKSKTDKLNYSYLVQFVYSPVFRSQLIQFLVAGAQPNISSKDIESVTIPFPSINEQQKISHFLSSIDTKLNLIETQIYKTKEFKKGLLQQMFV